MIKKIAWDTFKNTGNVNTFLELKQFQNMELELQSGTSDFKITENNLAEDEQKVEQYGDNKNEWNNNF